MSVITLDTTTCYHCGNDCSDEQFNIGDKDFCCHGCKEVYSILSTSGLGNYYCYNDHPGANRAKDDNRLDYLLEPSIVKDLVEYADDDVTIVTFYIPHIHCSSCIWLLEQMNRLNPAIYYSRVDFLRKQVNIRFNGKEIKLKGVVELLALIGYDPLISLQDIVKKQAFSKKDDLVRKIAVAGFCFGNVMLLSFPEYLGFSAHDASFKYFFGWLNLVFTLPVTFYSGWGYIASAYTNLRNKVLTIDFPLALGIVVLFIRSWAEIVTNTGAGFVDTLCGLIFFLLRGKFVQRKTYYHLSFERDYRSFFPVAVQVLDDNGEKHVSLSDLKVAQRIRIRHHEIIPADAILLKGEARVDFSFVTGESVPVSKTLGEVVYAGGRQMGGAIELEVIKPVSQSYLTRLWNNEAFTRNQDDRAATFNQKVSKYFTIVLLVVAIGSFLYWMPTDMHRATASLTAVLIIACPCALALSTPFTMSAALGICDRNLFYLKNAAVAYDYLRGEPRGKLNKGDTKPKGDCVDCRLCVDVCPTAIDIRQGTQVDCINCTACIDVCNEVMLKIDRPVNLIGFYSEEQIKEGKKPRFTPRMAGYSSIIVLLLGVLTFFVMQRSDVDVTVMRSAGLLYQQQPGGYISNLYNADMINKTDKDQRIELRTDDEHVKIKYVQAPHVLDSAASVKAVFFIWIPANTIREPKTQVKLNVVKGNKIIDRITTTFIGPVYGN